MFPGPRPIGLLRRADQAVVGVGVFLAGLGMAIWWWAEAGPEGRLVEIDQAPSWEASFQVDINQASWPELAQLPGVGPTLAQRIVQYRLEHGLFQNEQELTKVRGIGPKTLQRIRPYLLPLRPAASQNDLPSEPPILREKK